MNRVWLLKQLFRKGITSGYRYGALFGAIYGSSRAMLIVLSRYEHFGSDPTSIGTFLLFLLISGALIGAGLGLIFGAAVGAFAGMFVGIILGRLAQRPSPPASYRTTLISGVTIGTGILASILLYITRLDDTFLPAALAMIAAYRIGTNVVDWYIHTVETHTRLTLDIQRHAASNEGGTAHEPP